MNRFFSALQPPPSVSVPPSVRSQAPAASLPGAIAAWQELLPAHRLPVIAKTPLMVAAGLYFTGGSFARLPVVLTLLLTAGLWAVLYAVNETTDLELEAGKRVGGGAKRVLYGLCGAIGVGAFVVSPLLSLLCAAMVAGQFAYCLPPLRLKRWWWAVLLLSGTINPILRLECGALWGIHHVPPVVYATAIALHLGASLRSRTLQRVRDARLGYHIAPGWAEGVGLACSGLGLAGACRLCATPGVPPIFWAFTALAALFTLFAWSGRVESVARLRQGWLWFALLALIGIVALGLRRL